MGSSATSESEHEMKGRFLLDVVIGKGPAVVKLFPSEDEALLIGRNTFLILDFGLDIFDAVGGVDFQGDGLAGEGPHEDLHASAQSEDQVEGGLLLNVVVGESSAVFQLLAGEDQSLLVGGDAVLVLNLGFHGLDGVAGLDIESVGFSSQSLDENLRWHDSCCY